MQHLQHLQQIENFKTKDMIIFYDKNTKQAAVHYALVLRLAGKFPEAIGRYLGRSVRTLRAAAMNERLLRTVRFEELTERQQQFLLDANCTPIMTPDDDPDTMHIIRIGGYLQLKGSWHKQ